MMAKIISLFFILCVFLIISTDSEGNIADSTELPNANSTEFGTVTVSAKNETVNKTSLISAQAIWRHGPRTQLYTFPTDKYNPEHNKEHGEEGLEQLTKDGILQSYKLGKYLRSRYNRFLSENYSVEEFYVESSETSRTAMTALAVAQGLFPTFMEVEEGQIMWYPVYVKTISSKNDNYISQTRKCNRYDKIFSDYRNSSKINTQEALQLYDHLSRHSGMSVKDYVDVYALQDTIFNVQRDLFGHPVPEWASIVASKMYRMASLEYYGFVDSFEMMKFIAGPLLYKLVYNFNCTLGLVPPSTTVATATGNGSNESKNCTMAKFYGFSGHDTTISPLLYLFEHYDIDSPPPYNALLLFELHSHKNQHFIKIFYRTNNKSGEDATELLLKACGNISCEFTQFQEIYKSFIIDEENWIKECNK